MSYPESYLVYRFRHTISSTLLYIMEYTINCVWPPHPYPSIPDYKLIPQFPSFRVHILIQG